MRKPRLVLIKSTDRMPVEFYVKDYNIVVEESRGYRKYKLILPLGISNYYYWTNLRNGKCYVTAL